jgi:hypothetical protein
MFMAGASIAQDLPKNKNPIVVNATTIPAIELRAIQTGELQCAFDRR